MSEQGEFGLVNDAQEVDTQSNLILHRAAGIIRQAVNGITFQSHEYEPSDQFQIEKCRSFVPNLLIDFISWCTSKHDFDNASGVAEGSTGNDLLRVLAICHIISLSCSTHTPLSFGLGVQMHHDFGSKSLIDVLCSLGYSVSYDEVRRL